MKTKKSNPSVLAVITARGGSKGVPGKNIKNLGGKPLIAYTIESAKESKYITHLIVSTDDEEIAKICKNHGVKAPFLRPKELAQDDTPHLPVMQHAVSFVEKKLGVNFDYVVILQPTSPFRLAEDIDGTLEVLFSDVRADSAVSLVEVPSTEHPIKVKKLEDGRVAPYCIPEPEGIKRQDFPPAYKRSSGAYAMRRSTLMDKGKIYGDKIVGYITPPERYIDIDTPLDWVKAEYMLGELRKKGLFS